jgi:thiamine biosynthesis lipoprotein
VARRWLLLTRRSFIRLIVLTPFALQLEAKEVPRYTAEVRDLLMGSFVQIKGTGIEKETLLSAISYMKALESVLTRFDGTSGLSLLNSAGRLKNPHKELTKVLYSAREAYSETGGVFDVTVLPVLLHFETQRRPLTLEEQERFRALVGFDNVDFDAGGVALKKKGVKLTLDGIAKGYIIDRGVEHLRDRGCVSVLVNVGGDVYCGKNGNGWDVGIYNPLQDTISRKLKLETTAVCTSGNYVNYYSEDKKLHHIVDPRTLSSPTEFVSVTAIAGTTQRADVLSTALFAAGERGKSFLRQGEQAYLLTDKGQEIALTSLPS